MIRAIIWDLGNVLASYREVGLIYKRLARFSGRHSPQDIKKMIFGWLGGPAWGREFLSYHYDIGWIDTDEFLSRLRKKLGIDAPPLGPSDDRLKEAFNYCFEMDKDIRRALWFLADKDFCPRKISQGILSNINELQWNFVLSALPALRLRNDRERPGAIDVHVVSFREKMVKPEIGIYALTFAEMWREHYRNTKHELKPQEILFCDDRMENVLAAEEVGWRAECVESYGYQTLSAILDRYGVPLPPDDYIPPPERKYFAALMNSAKLPAILTGSVPQKS